jgi:hypothetical protein
VKNNPPSASFFLTGSEGVIGRVIRGDDAVAIEVCKMAEETGIAWTDSTINPWRGCTKVSEGCDANG